MIQLHDFVDRHFASDASAYSARYFTSVFRIVALDLHFQQIRIDAFLQQTNTEVQTPQSLQLANGYHRTESDLIAKNHCGADSKRFERAACFREDNIVL